MDKLINCPFCPNKIMLSNLDDEDFEIMVECSDCNTEFLLGVGVPYVTQEQLDNFSLTDYQKQLYKDAKERRNK